MSKAEVKFGDWLNRGLDLYKANWLVLIIVTAVMLVCFAIPFAIIFRLLAFHPMVGQFVSVALMALVLGPLAVGWARVVLSLPGAPQQPADMGAAINTLFQGYQQFKDASLLYLLVGGAGALVRIVADAVLPFFLASLLGLAVNIFVGAAVMFSLWLLADRKCDCLSSIKVSWGTVKDNFWMFLGFNLMAGVLAAVGAIACGVGIIATAPLYGCLLVVAYRDVFLSAAATAAPVAPPSP